MSPDPLTVLRRLVKYAADTITPEEKSECSDDKGVVRCLT
jgi:hypothetical protein